MFVSCVDMGFIIRKRQERGGDKMNPELIEAVVYTPKDIQKLMHLSKSSTYAFLKRIFQSKNPPFRIIKIGRLLRVIRKDFDEWIAEVHNKEESKAEEEKESSN